MAEHGSASNHIPRDIIADILSRLPTKTVFHFKFASKTWYALISDPTFIHLHSKRLSLKPKILISTTERSDLVRSGFHIVVDYENSSRIDFDIRGAINFVKEEPPVQPYKIIGSSFGLVCIATNYCGSFYLWNPTTGESRKIRNFGLGKIDHYEYLHGLSYDPTTNDFTIVISLYPIEYTRKPIAFNVFSLKANAWKKIVSPFGYYYNPSKYPCDWQYQSGDYGTTASQFSVYAATTPATILNGVFHWIVRVPHQIDPRIIAFDSAKDTFHELKIPKEKSQKLYMPAYHPSAFGDLCLLEHKGCLCLVCYDWFNKRREIWMMKEYGDHKSWIHWLSFKSSTTGAKPGCMFKPMCITQLNEVVFHTDNNIERWSLKNELTNQILYRTHQKDEHTGSVKLTRDIFGAAVLVDETLISPYDFTQMTSLMSVRNCFSRVLDIFRIVIEILMSLWRHLDQYS